MKKIVIFIMIILTILLNISTTQWKKVEDNISYDDYIIELDKNYGDDKNKIIDKINEEISDNKNTKEYIGVNLLVRQYYFYLWGDNKRLIKYADETESYLRKYNMENELLNFYSMMSSIYIGNEKYNMGYIYIYKGEYIAKKIYEENKSEEMLSTLIAIKYLKAVIAIDIGMENTAEIVFKEAEELRTEDVEERVDVYTNILLYYKHKEEYNLVEEYALKVIKLIDEKYKNKDRYRRDYTRAQIILAENYIHLGKINKGVKITKELSNDKDLFKENIYRDEMYCLYSQIYKYYGMEEESIKYLKMAYNKIKNTEMKTVKIKIVKLIIEQLELIGDKEELLHWYKIQSEILRTLQGSIDTQYLLSQIIDIDLENANYSIEMLKLQRLKMTYFIITLLLLITIIIIVVIVESKRKKCLKENINILEKNIIINQKYYESIKTNNENIKRINHDIKNHMIVINKLMWEKEYEHVINYVKNIEKETDYSNSHITTNNKIIDAIISSKIDICKLENINLDLDIKIPEKIAIEDFDICVIYGNLLDNAIEACRRINENKLNKYIKLKSITKGDYLFINIKNAYDGNIKIKKDKFLTNKEDKINHGIGIKNIKKSLKKYNGDMKINYIDKEFQVSIIINISE